MDLSEPFLSTGLLWSVNIALVPLVTPIDPWLPVAFRISCKPLSTEFKTLLDLVSAYFLALLLPLFYMNPGLRPCKEPHCFILSTFGHAFTLPRSMPI